MRSPPRSRSPAARKNANDIRLTVARSFTDTDVFRPFPKVDLHRHLEGTLRIETMLEIARAHAITVPASLSGLVQVQDGDPQTFQNFLAKFNTLRLFYRSPEVIHRITREAVEDAAKDNVRYLELRFTPVALSRAERFPLHDVMNWVADSAREAAKKFKVKVGLIASVNRHESPELAEQVTWLAAEHFKDGMVGIDLAGNEAEYPAQPFLGIFKEARQAGLHTTIHAGEWGGAQNVREAIESFDVERIGHGVRTLEDSYTTALAKEHGTVFEVCVTSNMQSGVIPASQKHPLPKMMEAGLNVTVNSDDPSISRINLSHEYRVVCAELGVPVDALKQRILAAAQASFLPEKDKNDLVKSVKKELKL
ncbi:MAG: adenosine deaminase [Anaerolineae bacterium UTCFX3]|nr:MAG: adenosine deaminase [Anaerolineae bacterium UTCFX3]